MSYPKSVVLPVSPDEAFALITEPERLRRWQTVSAYVANSAHRAVKRYDLPRVRADLHRAAEVRPPAPS